ncbi:MAG: hypothetical protein M1828_005329 [Chrysothrix sp. TS-e1954]|nr:MAG: hypothetical protein M1828_005329 [Chrysothrix sp. TS-e1954]
MLGTNPTTSSPQNHPNSPHDNKKTNPVIPIAACLGVVGFFLIVAAFIVFARRSRRVSHKPSRSDVNVNVSKEWPSHPSSQQHGAVMYHPQGKMRGYQELGELGKGAREKTRWQRRKEAPLPATPPPPPPPKSGGGGLGVSYGKG